MLAVDEHGVLCTTCYFLPGSEAGGCVLELSLVGGDTDYTAVHLSRKINEREVTGCIKNLLTGEYRVEVYDIEKEGYKMLGASPAVVIEGVSVSKMVTPTSASSIMSRLSTTELMSVLVPDRSSIETSMTTLNCVLNMIISL